MTPRRQERYWRGKFIASAGLLLGWLIAATLWPASNAGGYAWDLPAGFPEPAVPADNPMTGAKAELGRYLFYDKRVSGNGTQSCATCHEQRFAFTDGNPRAVGSTGEIHPRGSMSLVNVAYTSRLTWVNPNLDRLEDQALVPMLGDNPVELGLKGLENRFLNTIMEDEVYQRLSQAAFPAQPEPFTLSNVTKALACFQRTILSARSPYDRYHSRRDASAVSESAKRGEVLFFSSEKAGCFRCHGGVTFGGAIQFAGREPFEEQFHNTGLYNLRAALSYPEPNTGLYAYTGKSKDVGKFRAPTLRNIAVTAPYMHDGSIKTLNEVLDHYQAGGRKIESGPYAGDGSQNPNKSPLTHKFKLTEAERADLIEFLHALTDEELLRDPRWSDPWPSTLENRPPRN